MLTSITYVVGLAAICGYVYVGSMFGRVSAKAGNGIRRAAWDAFVWPVMGWAAIEKLYKVTPTEY